MTRMMAAIFVLLSAGCTLKESDHYRVTIGTGVYLYILPLATDDIVFGIHGNLCSWNFDCTASSLRKYELEVWADIGRAEWRDAWSGGPKEQAREVFEELRWYGLAGIRNSYCLELRKSWDLSLSWKRVGINNGGCQGLGKSLF